MTRSNGLAVLFKGLFGKTMGVLRDRLGWRAYMLFVLLLMVAFSALIIALELIPSHRVVDTTFVATLETQDLSLRLGSSSLVISDIASDGIELGERGVLQGDETLMPFDLTQLPAEEVAADNGSRTFRKLSEAAHLELDTLLIPAGGVVEISTSGQGSSLELQVIDAGGTPSEATIVWSGEVEGSAPGPGFGDRVGSERWSAAAPFIQLAAPRTDGPISVPLSVVGLSTERIVLRGADPVATSALIAGELQFYFRSQPSQPIALRNGEFTRFSGLDAQITNLELSDRGLRFVLVGHADAIHIGYQSNLRDVTPSLLEGFLSSRSLVIIVTSGFTFLLALLSAVGLRRES